MVPNANNINNNLITSSMQKTILVQLPAEQNCRKSSADSERYIVAGSKAAREIVGTIK